MPRAAHVRKRTLGAALALAGLLGLAGCGQANRTSATPGASGTSGAQDFAQVMGAHDQGALFLARLAEQRGLHPETRGLAAEMVGSRTLEAQQLRSALARLQPSRPSEDQTAPVDLSSTSLVLARLGVPASELGLPPPAGFSVQTGSLELADPFDRSFIDVAVRYNRGAIELAQAGLRVADDPELERLASSIIRSRACEIQALNGWRRRWHGLPSPAGGVPGAARRALRGGRDCP